MLEVLAGIFEANWAPSHVHHYYRQAFRPSLLGFIYNKKPLSLWNSCTTDSFTLGKKMQSKLEQKKRLCRVFQDKLPQLQGSPGAPSLFLKWNMRLKSFGNCGCRFWRGWGAQDPAKAQRRKTGNNIPTVVRKLRGFCWVYLMKN